MYTELTIGASLVYILGTLDPMTALKMISTSSPSVELSSSRVTVACTNPGRSFVPLTSTKGFFISWVDDADAGTDVGGEDNVVGEGGIGDDVFVDPSVSMSIVKVLFFLSRPKALATMPDMYDLRGAIFCCERVRRLCVGGRQWLSEEREIGGQLNRNQLVRKRRSKGGYTSGGGRGRKKRGSRTQ